MAADKQAVAEGLEAVYSAQPRGREINFDVHIAGMPQKIGPTIMAAGPGSGSGYVPIDKRLNTAGGWATMDQLVAHLEAAGEEPLVQNDKGDMVRVVEEVLPIEGTDQVRVVKRERHVVLTRDAARYVTSQGIPADTYMAGVGWIRNGIKPERDHATLEALRQEAVQESELLTREEFQERQQERVEKTRQRFRRNARRANQRVAREEEPTARRTDQADEPDRASAARAAQAAARAEKKD